MLMVRGSWVFVGDCQALDLSRKSAIVNKNIVQMIMEIFPVI